MRLNIIFFFNIFLSFNTKSYGEINNIISLKIGNKIITNYKIKNKILNYFSFSNQIISQKNIDKLKVNH